MGVVQVLLALTAVLAYTQAAVVYGPPRVRVAAARRHPSRSIVNGGDSYIPERLRQVRGKAQGYVIKDNNNFGRQDGLRRHRLADNGYGLRDTTLGRRGSLSSRSSYDGPSSRSSSGRKYNAGSLVRDVYNDRRRGGSRFDSGRQVGGGYGLDGQVHPIANRKCHCGVNQVCDLNRLGEPTCRSVRGGGIRPIKNPRGACDRPEASRFFNRCNASRGVRGTRAYIYFEGSCQPFTTTGTGYCRPMGLDNNIFYSRLECEEQCHY